MICSGKGRDITLFILRVFHTRRYKGSRPSLAPSARLPVTHTGSASGPWILLLTAEPGSGSGKGLGLSSELPVRRELLLPLTTGNRLQKPFYLTLLAGALALAEA